MVRVATVSLCRASRLRLAHATREEAARRVVVRSAPVFAARPVSSTRPGQGPSPAASRSRPQPQRNWLSARRFIVSAAAAAPEKVVEFKLSDIGEGIAEVEVLKWHVAVGDEIDEMDLLCEVQSDKATVEITSRYGGTIKALRYAEREMAQTGTTLVDIVVDSDAVDDDTADSTPALSASAEGVSASSPPLVGIPATITASGKALATPAVRHIARSHGIDIAQVPATGRGGRVLKEDIMRFIQGGAPAPTLTPAPVTPPAPAAPAPAAVNREDTEIPLSGYGKVMVKTMNAANAVPHFGYDDEIVMDRLIEVRSTLKAQAEARGIKLSFMPFLMKAASLAMLQYPGINAHFDAGREVVIQRAAHNIGLAVDTPDGLIVPNVKNCEQKSILEIAADINRLQADAARGVVAPADLRDGTFTLSNIGSIGGTYMSAVLVVPEVVIGALGKTQRVPRFASPSSDEVVARNIMNVSWAADHRVLDGATVARFSNLWKDYIESPDAMLLDLR